MKSEDTPSIIRLPLEVLEVFIDASSISSQLSISRVSKLFHSLTLRALYRNISLSSPPVSVVCCRTLTTNRRAAATVRSFIIDYAYYSPSSNSYLASYYILITKALVSLSDLHTLKLLVCDPYFVSLLKDCTFPALRQFECHLTPSAPLIDFLNRHRKINYLQVSPHEDTSGLFLFPNSEGFESLPELELPVLQYFTGNAQTIPFLGKTSTLRAAIITWNAVDTDPDLAFAALERSNGNNLVLLSCRRRGWNTSLFEAISNRLPQLVSLHISNVLMVDSNPSDSYLQAIRGFLPRFSQLRRLSISCIDYWEMGNVSSLMDKDFATVSDWGDVCGTLEEISLPHSNGLCWYRLPGNAWIPDPKESAGGTWLYENVVLKRNPKWSIIVDGIGLEIERTTSERGLINFGLNGYTETIAVVRRQLGGFLKENDIGQKDSSH